MVLAGFATSIEEDERILASAGGVGNASSGPGGPIDGPVPSSAQAGGQGPDAAPASDPCHVAAVKYRLERKRLIAACKLVLSVYARDE